MVMEQYEADLAEEAEGAEIEAQAQEDAGAESDSQG